MPIQSKQQPPYYQTKNPTKIYQILAQQTGTDPITISETIINEIGEIVWTYVTTGTYRGTKTGAFTNVIPQTQLILRGNTETLGFYSITKENNNSVLLKTAFAYVNAMDNNYLRQETADDVLSTNTLITIITY